MFFESWILFNCTETPFCNVPSRALRDPETETETAVFVNPESRPKVGFLKARDRDPESVRYPLEFGTNVFPVAQI